MEIRMKASDAIRMLQITSARLRAGKALFDPIKIDILEHKGKYKTAAMMMNAGGTAYVISRFFNIQVDGMKKDTDICVSADTLISYFEECYGSDETIKMWDDGIYWKAINEDAEYPTEIKHPMISKDDGSVRALEEIPFKMKDGIPYYQDGTVKPDTEVMIDVSEIHKAIKHKITVAKHAKGGRSPKYYDFHFTEEESIVVLGDPNDVSMTPITKTLNCKVKGPGAKFMVGDEDLELIMGVLTDEITIYCKTDYPIWITKKGDDYGVGYLIAPKAEEETVEVEVTEDGDVEVMDIDEEEEVDIEIEDDEETSEETSEDDAEEASDEIKIKEKEVEEPVEEPVEDPEEEPEEKDIPEAPLEDIPEGIDEDEEDLVGLDLDIS